MDKGLQQSGTKPPDIRTDLESKHDVVSEPDDNRDFCTKDLSTLLFREDFAMVVAFCDPMSSVDEFFQRQP